MRVVVLHFNFIGGIFADHVQNGQAATRVTVEPAVETQDIVLVDDNGLALGDKVGDLVGLHDAVAVHDCGLGRCYCGWRS